MTAVVLTDAERAELIGLEEAMWRPETRYEAAFQQRHFAPDFIEFGRSGRVHTREALILTGARPIRCQLPLPHLMLRPLDANTVQITYDSIVTAEDGQRQHAHRSSIWSRGAHGWALRFHQGTPFVPGVDACR